MSNEYHCDDELYFRYESLIDLFRKSNQEPQEFIAKYLDDGTVSTDDVAHLIEYLHMDMNSRSFALADLSDSEAFRVGLYETDQTDPENNPLFIIQFDAKMNQHKAEVDLVLEDFARALAQIACTTPKPTAISADFKENTDDMAETIFDSMPHNSTCH